MKQIYFILVILVIAAVMGSPALYPAYPGEKPEGIVVYFDIGDTLGSAVISRSPLKIERLKVYDYVKPILQRLGNKKIRLGIISNTIPGDTGEDMKKILEASGIYKFFEPRLLIYSSVVGLRKDSPEIFKLAARRAGHGTAPGNCIFVGENEKERLFAKEAGFRAVDHPKQVEKVLVKK
ncbi:MAG: HAD family hydrolase [bacterium]|nr:HAD family hydrolase [bacterium]